jgi:predicted ATPase
VAAELTELRLPRFKSVRDAVIPIRPLTLIVGRNGSGKSNVLDGLAVLAALASGTDLRDALDGGRDGPVVRGGSEGCSPLGSKSFTIGCTAHQDSQEIYLDVEIQTSPSLQIISERLWTVRKSGVRKGEALDYLRSEPPQPYSGDIVARWDNGKRGTNPGVTFRASQLLTSQIGVRVPATTQAGRRVHEAAAIVLGAISGIFILDPVPHQMREYVPEKDSRLRRNADNLSATLARLLRSKSLASTLLAMTQSLSEAQVSKLSSVSSELGDVMITIVESIGGTRQPVPARLMSDGTLRFLAIAAAMLDVPEANESQQEDDGGRVLVVEELENGLHPSQAALLLSRLKGSAQEREVRTVATTHSPAILDALTGQDHESVVVSSRDKDGWSRITRLVDFPDYFEVVGRTSLGASATMDRLRPGKVNEDAVQQTLTSIFGN